jgi:DNA-binding MarR family transcriptional regulator
LNHEAEGTAMPQIAQRGSFLLLFALNQQLGSLLAQAMARAPLRPADFAVYSTLRLLQPTTPTELATTLGMRVTTLSSLLTKMERQGHLCRELNPADGRSRLISLTAAGQRATEDCFPGFSAAIEAFRRHLSTDEDRALQQLEEIGEALIGATRELAGRPRQQAGQP